MKYYITYNLKSDLALHIEGPFEEFNYMDKAIDIISQDGVYNLDIINEMAMEFYFAWREVEDEYEAARQRLIDNPPNNPEYTLQDEVDAYRVYNSFPKEFLESIFLPEEEETLKTIDTIKTMDMIESIGENGFESWDDDFPF